MKTEKTARYFLLWLLLISTVTRAVLSFIYVNYPDIPHDICYYIWVGKILLSGKSLYGTLQPNGVYHPYGPLGAVIYTTWIMLFGGNYIVVKLISIVFDVFTIIIVFYLLKELVNENIAKWGSFLYSFSYLTLLSAGVLGNDDNIILFFILLSIYLLIKNKPILAMAYFGTTLGFGIKILPVLPAIVYYFYRTYDLKRLMGYLSIMVTTLFLILVIFYFNSGLNILHPYLLANTPPFNMVQMLSPLNLPRLLTGFYLNAVHYLSTHTVIPKDLNPIPPHINHPINLFFNQIATPYFILGVIFLLWYMLKFRLANKKIELLRNSFLWIFGALVFSKLVTDLYYLWFLCPLLILILFKEQGIFNTFKLKSQEIFGTILTFIGLLLFALICCRGERIEIWREVILLIPIIISLGTYLMFYRSKIRRSWAILISGLVCFEVEPMNPLLILKPLLVKYIPEVPLSFGTYLSYATLYPFSILTNLIVLIGIVLLAKDMHWFTTKDEITSLSSNKELNC